MNKILYKNITFCSDYDFEKDDLAHMSSLFSKKSGNPGSLLGGRSGVCYSSLEGIGNIVVKYYTRGGLIYHFNKNRYIGFGETRSESEYAYLKRAAEAGVNVPDPIVSAYTGKPFYKAWLITRRVENHKTLAEVYLENPDRGRELTSKLNTMVNRLIDNSIYHVDLHPGNVLTDDHDKVYIIDFDKAGMPAFGKKRLVELYVKRWKRALIKHGLPMFDLNLKG